MRLRRSEPRAFALLRSFGPADRVVAESRSRGERRRQAIAKSRSHLAEPRRRARFRENREEKRPRRVRRSRRSGESRSYERRSQSRARRRRGGFVCLERDNAPSAGDPTAESYPCLRGTDLIARQVRGIIALRGGERRVAISPVGRFNLFSGIVGMCWVHVLCLYFL